MQNYANTVCSKNIFFFLGGGGGGVVSITCWSWYVVCVLDFFSKVSFMHFGYNVADH